MDIVHNKSIIKAIHKTLHYITICVPMNEKKNFFEHPDQPDILYCNLTPYTNPYTNQGKEKTKRNRHERDREKPYREHE